MTPQRRRKFALASAAVSALLAIPAFGQVAVGSGGHANDANNQVGSGGYNSNVSQPGVTPNQVIYGNVTGGVGFSGPLGERDPGAFMGPIPTLGDQFVRTTSGVPTSYQTPTASFTPRPYYGDSRAVAPPVGSISNGYSGGYLGSTQYQGDNAYSLRNEVASSLDLARQQGGKSDVIGSNLLPTNLGPDNGQDLNGIVSPQGSVPLFTGSPLYGLVSLNDIAGGIPNTDQSALFGAPSLAPGGTDRFRQSSTSIKQMQTELLNQQNGGVNLQNGNQLNSSDINNQNNNQNNGPNTLQPGSLNSTALNNPPDGPQNGSLNGSQNSGIGNQNLQSGTDTQQGYQQRMNTRLTGAGQNQNNLLVQRLQQYQNPIYQRMVEAAKFNQQLQANARKTGGPIATVGPTSRPAGSTMLPQNGLPGTNTQGNPPSANGSTPFDSVKVKSLGEGVTAKGLHDLLTSAEDLMRQDKFESAIKKYNTAEEVSPDNGLIALGRANAELGAGFYQLASVDLHQLFEKDPALLMGQYDLANWLSPRRLKFINKELTDLALSDEKQEMPMFLLTYIAYNTGDAAKAAQFLESAKQRAGGRDPVLEKLQASWHLSSDLNK